MATIHEIVQAFLEWFESSDHAKSEDFYEDEITQERMQNLSREGFIDFFQSFAAEGGRIQSGGHRTAGRFGDEVEKNYDNFRLRALEPFQKNFNLEDWLTWAETVPYFSPGHCTIFLNRVDKHRYVIVNQKSIAGYELLSGQKASGKIVERYRVIEAFEKKLLEDFPALQNFFRVDALMHYLIGTEEGKRWLPPSEEDFDYFDLEGMHAYAAKVKSDYDPKDPAAAWYKKTQEQLKHLVRLLDQRIGRQLKVNYIEKPKGMGGPGKFIFRNYVVVGFAPDNLFTGPKSDLFIHLVFQQLSENPVFELAVNVNFSKKGNPFIPRREAILEATTVRFPVDAQFPGNWGALLDRIEGPVRMLIDQFVQIAMGANPANSEVRQNQWNMPNLNQILYGPPGTGKTYEALFLAVELATGKRPADIQEANAVFNQLRAIGQIAFITFHQSMGYEDFIEGIRPLPPDEDKPIQYAVVDGIFKRLSVEAAFALASTDKKDPVEQTISFSQRYDQFLGEVQERLAKGDAIEYETVSGGHIVVDGVSDRNNLVVRHRKSQKTYIVSKDRLSRLSDGIPDLSTVSNIDAKFREVIGGSNATANWAILNAIRHLMSVETDGRTELSSMDYEDKKRVVARLQLENYNPVKAQRYVLIIDEINRGNVAQIFGELITLIEEDKRMGKQTSLSVTLPYSGESFSVPPNLYLIGTMNTADRSVEALDTALRRRFSFVHTKPEPEHLKPTQEGIDLKEMLKIINQRLEVLIDADHTIGHAWLWEVKDLERLKSAFKDKILPLLQEFFYNDYEKIGLVLGEKFVALEKVKAKVFARFNGGSDLGNEYADRVLYRITAPATWDEAAFRSIYATRQENA